MTVSSGFFNAISSDRKYSAAQMGQLFDGLILNGVYESEGDAFAVVEDSPVSMDIDVGSGRAWFNSTWTFNDAAITLTVSTADPLLPRIDYIYLEVNKETATRANKIDIMAGTPASSPIPPTLTQSGNVYQYPIAEIYVGAGVTVINNSNITMTTGTVDCPFVTGPISGNIIVHEHEDNDTGGVLTAAAIQNRERSIWVDALRIHRIGGSIDTGDEWGATVIFNPAGATTRIFANVVMPKDLVTGSVSIEVFWVFDDSGSNGIRINFRYGVIAEDDSIGITEVDDSFTFTPPPGTGDTRHQYSLATISSVEADDMIVFEFERDSDHVEDVNTSFMGVWGFLFTYTSDS